MGTRAHARARASACQKAMPPEQSRPLAQIEREPWDTGQVQLADGLPKARLTPLRQG